MCGYGFSGGFGMMSPFMGFGSFFFILLIVLGIGYFIKQGNK